MRRGTTPTLIFVLPFDCGEITVANIAVAQNKKVIIEKALSECTTDGNKLSTRLSEEETLLIDCSIPFIEIQLRVGCGNDRLASDIFRRSSEEILKDGCLT